MQLPACSCVAESISQMQTAETNTAGGCGTMAPPQTGRAFLQTQIQNNLTMKSVWLKDGTYKLGACTAC
jgi:hypothetical protein